MENVDPTYSPVVPIFIFLYVLLKAPYILAIDFQSQICCSTFLILIQHFYWVHSKTITIFVWMETFDGCLLQLCHSFECLKKTKDKKSEKVENVPWTSVGK